MSWKTFLWIFGILAAATVAVIFFLHHRALKKIVSTGTAAQAPSDARLIDQTLGAGAYSGAISSSQNVDAGAGEAAATGATHAATVAVESPDDFNQASAESA